MTRLALVLSSIAAASALTACGSSANRDSSGGGSTSGGSTSGGSTSGGSNSLGGTTSGGSSALGGSTSGGSSALGGAGLGGGGGMPRAGAAGSAGAAQGGAGAQAGGGAPTCSGGAGNGSVPAGCDLDVARQAALALGLALEGCAETFEQTLPSDLASDSNWGVKAPLCEAGGYDLEPAAGSTVCLVGQDITELCQSYPARVWVVMRGGQVVCIYKALRPGTRIAPGVYSANDPLCHA